MVLQMVLLDRLSQHSIQVPHPSFSNNARESPETSKGGFSMRCTLIVGVLALMGSVVLQAQQAPKPGPEHKKLGVFLGSWSVDGEIKSNNGYGSPAGKWNMVERYQWMPGEFFLQMNRDGKGPAGENKEIFIFGYDPRAKKYTAASYDLNDGSSASGTLTNNGNTWIWSGSGYARDGKRYQERCTTTVVPNASFTVKCETSPDGKSWAPAYEAKATKSKS
jgi:hypothetical protein